LDRVVGHEAAKGSFAPRCRMDREGLLHMAPMGYLNLWPVGTGKDFSRGVLCRVDWIPCLELRNFRSKYLAKGKAIWKKC
jgi:hypothetical protein